MVDRRAATATGLGVPLTTGHEEITSTLTPQKWEKRGAQRGRMLSEHQSAEDAPPKKLNNAPGRILLKQLSAENARLKKVNNTPMSAEPKLVEEVEDDEEQERQAELRRAQDQLQKCLQDQDYTGAADAQEKISALMSAVSTFFGRAASANSCFKKMRPRALLTFFGGASSAD